jgi:hypothetical protein
MMQHTPYHKLNGARIVRERRMNIELVNYPARVITRGTKYRRGRVAWVTFAVKLG